VPFLYYDSITIKCSFQFNHFWCPLSGVRVAQSAGFWIAFVDHLYTQLRTSSNYRAITNLHTLQFTTAHTKSFPACYVITSCSLVRVSNCGDPSASVLKASLNGGSLPTYSFLHRFLYRTDLVAPVVFLISPWHGPHRQHCSVSYANRFRGNMFTEPFPRSGRLFLLIKNQLPSYRHCSVVCFGAAAKKQMLFQSHLLATAVSLAPQFLLWANMPQYNKVCEKAEFSV
jgi:hypothetical protein